MEQAKCHLTPKHFIRFKSKAKIQSFIHILAIKTEFNVLLIT